MVKSPIKIIDSGTVPTTANLTEGQIAFGTVDGETKLYGSDGTTVSELGGGGGSEVNVITPLKVDTAPTADDGDKKSIVIGDKAVSTLGDTSGLPEEIKEGLDAMVSAYGGTNNVVVGGSGLEHENAKGEGLYNVSIGPGAQAGILEYDAENPQSMTKLMNNVAVGVDAVANGGKSIAIGAVKATGSGSIAIGGSNATSEGEVVISSGTMYGGGRHGGAIIASRGVVQGLEDAPNVVISSNVSADSRGGQGVVAIGGAQIDIYGGGPAVDAIAIGRNAYIYHADSNERSVAIGAETYVGSAGSVAIGHGSRASGAYVFSVGSGNTGHNGATRRIINVTNPVNAQDAATKKYVDDQYSTLEAQIDDKGTDITALQGQVSTLETTVAGKADTSALDNYATKTELSAKADQTTVDSLIATVNSKVSSVTAGEGISITGSATAPVVNGMIAVPDYKNAQTEITASSGSPFTVPKPGVIYNAYAIYSDGGSSPNLYIIPDGDTNSISIAMGSYAGEGRANHLQGVYPVSTGDQVYADVGGGMGYVSFAPYKFVEIS